MVASCKQQKSGLCVPPNVYLSYTLDIIAVQICIFCGLLKNKSNLIGCRRMLAMFLLRSLMTKMVMNVDIFRLSADMFYGTHFYNMSKYILIACFTTVYCCCNKIYELRRFARENMAGTRSSFKGPPIT
jgi:hypothetical protein